MQQTLIPASIPAGTGPQALARAVLQAAQARVRAAWIAACERAERPGRFVPRY